MLYHVKFALLNPTAKELVKFPSGNSSERPRGVEAKNHDVRTVREVFVSAPSKLSM